jgi:short subunit dehydrogenase-like uncharacterized protein
MGWMIYGANGYAAGLVVEEALRRGLRPLLAGRRDEAVRPLAERHGLPCRIFDLERAARGIDGVGLVAHLAGPYSRTARPMVEACLAAGVHYVDVNGEIDVCEQIFELDERARAARVVLLPAAGYDVVPTDCLAALLGRELPDARELELAFGGFGGATPSRGSLKTLLENLGRGGRVRIGGELRDVPFTWRTPRIAFPQGTFRCVTVPWADVSTAWRSTGIADVAVYMAAPPGLTTALRLARPALGSARVTRSLQALTERALVGPGAAARGRASTGAWGRVRNARGERVEAALSGPDGYTVTARTVVMAVERVLAGQVEPGARPPALALGADLVREIEGLRLGPFTRSVSRP